MQIEGSLHVGYGGVRLVEVHILHLQANRPHGPGYLHIRGLSSEVEHRSHSNLSCWDEVAKVRGSKPRGPNHISIQPCMSLPGQC